MLSLLLLGSQGLLHGGRDIGAAIQYRKAWALLAYLSVEHDRRHSREHLAQLLWPQLGTAAARTNLRQVLANLNRVFEAAGAPGWLDLERDAVALTPHPRASSDVQALFRFAHGGAPGPQELAKVGAIVPRFGAELLGELSFPDCAEFEEWLQLARARLATLGAEALQRIAEAHHAAGRHLDAVAIARRLVARDEWNEAHHRLLMRLLVEAGQPQQALTVYRALRESLRAELDSEPEAATDALHATIEAAVQAGVAPVLAAAAAAARPTRVRRWFTAVHCRLRTSGPGAERQRQALAGMLREAGATLLPSAADGPTACFLGSADPIGARRSAWEAARAALAAAEAHGTQAAFALCTGLASVDPEQGTVAPLGNPLPGAVGLSALAPAGSVVLCEALQRWLAPAFELRPLPPVRIEGMDGVLPLWALGRARARRRAWVPAEEEADAAGEELQTLQVPASRAGERGVRAWLTLVEGGERGKRIALRGEPTVIGRASDADVQIAHGTVSRHHCLVWLEDGRFRVRDLGATNRTRVNDVVVLERELADGDRVRLGDAMLAFAQRRAEASTLPLDGAQPADVDTSRMR